VAWRSITHSVTASLLAGLDSPSHGDQTALIELHTRLVSRIAEIYGHKNINAQTHETILSAALNLAFQTTGQRLSRVQPAIGWLAGGALGAAATLLVGQLALAFYGDGLTAGREWLGQQWERLSHALPRR
jgi:hypothetical protein